MSVNLKKPLTDLLKEHDACSEGRNWARGYATASEAWQACEDPQWMLWGLSQIGYHETPEGQSKLRLWACRCVRETPLADGRKVWDLLTDPRSRAAVEVAERFARGEATQEELDTARAAAWDAAWAAAWAVARGASRDAAKKWQADCLREMVGNPFKPK